MTFKDAVEQTTGLGEAYCRGLRALRSQDRTHVDAQDTQRLSGSVDLDSVLQADQPNDPRWDYGVGHRPSNLNGREMIYWIEIHPATDGEVKVVIGKLQWLKQWLSSSARKLNAMHREFVWLSSGKTSLTLTAPQRKKMALEGLQHKGGHFRIPNRASG